MTLHADSRTGVFCQPECAAAPGDPAVTRRFDSAREALAAGFRPCRDCAPLLTGIADPAWLLPLMSEVEADPARRWHDHDLDMMGIDPTMVRRWFVANHGLTFHAYTRLRRLGSALKQIQHGEPVERAALLRDRHRVGAELEAPGCVGRVGLQHPVPSLRWQRYRRHTCTWIDPPSCQCR